MLTPPQAAPLSPGQSGTTALGRRWSALILALLAAAVLLLAWGDPALAAETAAPALADGLTAPGFWYLLAAGMALLVPAGLC